MRSFVPLLFAFIVALFAASSGLGALADSASLCSSGTLDERIVACSKVIRGNAKATWAYINRGVAYARKGDYDKAIADETKAIEINPTPKQSRRSGRDCRRSSNRAVGCRSRASPTVRSGGG
jgi:tetratricopeptide (TPR) repeat protein